VTLTDEQKTGLAILLLAIAAEARFGEDWSISGWNDAGAVRIELRGVINNRRRGVERMESLHDLELFGRVELIPKNLVKDMFAQLRLCASASPAWWPW